MAKKTLFAPITFNDKKIYGSANIIVASPPELNVRRTYYWGINGMSEVVGSPAGRDLSLSMWLHRRYLTRQSVEAAIEEINSWIGEHGKLKEEDRSSGFTAEYDKVTFHGLTRQSIGGRDDPSPIFDYAGTVDSGWVQAVSLKFYQLVPKKSAEFSK